MSPTLLEVFFPHHTCIFGTESDIQLKKSPELRSREFLPSCNTRCNTSRVMVKVLCSVKYDCLGLDWFAANTSVQFVHVGLRGMWNCNIFFVGVTAVVNCRLVVVYAPSGGWSTPTVLMWFYVNPSPAGVEWSREWSIWGRWKCRCAGFLYLGLIDC